MSEPHKGETGKAYDRRMREGFFDRYIQGDGIDIGCGNDPILLSCARWDKEQGDATLMDGVPDNRFDWVYASHVLEHLHEPELALLNWLRILKPGGHLIVVVPSRRLYEKSNTLPSRWNGDHKTYWEPCSSGTNPWTHGLMVMMKCVMGSVNLNHSFRSLRLLNDGYEAHGPTDHPSGEYSIELIIQK